ncbi:MAG: hypothetical protein RJB38_530 [Pseudomonadota bacterium]|jgi:two-component system chemotaxis sensor kinase CheA
MTSGSNDQDFMEELRRDFLTEVSFLLEQCEESYLKLENPDLRQEELGKIFRLAHSLKGTGAAVGFTDLAHFAHRVEDGLTLLRADPSLVSADVVTLLLRCGDAFRVRIQQLQSKDPTPWDVADLEREVQALIERFQSGGAFLKTPLDPVPGTVLHPESISNDAAWEALASTAQKSVQAETSEAPRSVVPEGAALEGGKPKASQQVHSVASSATKREVLKIDSERVEGVLNLVGELVVLKSQLINRTEGADSAMTQLVSLMDRTIRELQDKTLSMRVTPLKSLFLKTQRVVRDLSVKLQKPIEFVMEGEETEIDRGMVDALSDPLMHLARNSLDHGIEAATARTASGKSEKGKITMRAYHRGGRIIIELADDGKGLQRERILQKALEKGLVPAASAGTLADREVFSLIFAPGFSTAEKVTDVSGRGVGMDVVKTQVEKLKGSIELESVPSVGTVVRISLPMTTSILDGMLVRIGGDSYILPMENIRELVDLDSRQIMEVVTGKTALKHRDQLFPVIDMQQGFQAGRFGNPNLVAIVDSGGKDVALLLSGVAGQSQVVLKSLDDRMRACRGVSGAAILGDGRVALVLDTAGMAQAQAQDSEAASPPLARNPSPEGVPGVAA